MWSLQVREGSGWLCGVDTQAVAQGELGECWQGGEMAAGPDKVYRKSQCGGEGPSVRIFLTVFGPFPQ